MPQNEEMFEQLINVSPIASLIVDENMKIVFRNRKFTETFGYSEDEVKTVEDWWPRAYPDEKYRKVVIKEWFKRVETAIKNHTEIEPVEAQITCKDGSKKHMKMNMSSLGNRNFVAFTDLTDLKKALETIKHNEERYRLLLNSANDAIFLMSNDKFIDCNAKTLKMFGCKKAEILGMPPYKFSPEYQPDGKSSKEKALEKITAAFNGIPQFFEWRHKRYDGTLFDAEVSLNVLVLDDEKYLLALVRDISERKIAEKKLKQKNKELEDIIYITSHDLKTPLVNIEGFGAELKSSYKQLKNELNNVSMPAELHDMIYNKIDSDITESLKYIKGNVTKMLLLVDGMHVLSSVSSKAESRDMLNMNELVGDILDTVNFQIKQNNIEVNMGVLPECYGDPLMINQVFSNLVDNAIKYRDPSRKSIIKIFGLKNAKSVTFCIEDNGIGISPEYHEKIFKIFHRLNPQEGAGIGLGLTIVKRLLNKNSGTISVESEAGKGSKFIVTLPVK